MCECKSVIIYLSLYLSILNRLFVSFVECEYDAIKVCGKRFAALEILEET